jgi:hypothetical protein
MAITYTATGISDLTGTAAKALHQKYIAKYNLEGLCASWSMDWVKKRLKKPGKLNATTYDSDARIKKIAKRHALQVTGGLPAVARAYGLRIAATAAYEYRLTTDFDGAPTETENGNFGAATYYYVSILSREGNRHGFAMYSTGPVLADAYSGIYNCAGGTCEEVAKDHSVKVFRSQHETFVRLEAFTLTG